MNTAPPLALRVLPGAFAVCRLPPGSALPAWFSTEGFASASWNVDELSLTCAQERVPEQVQCERDWRCLMLQGPFAFELTGVLLRVLRPLAAAGIGIFAVSTFDTDYVLVKHSALEAALRALADSGLRIVD